MELSGLGSARYTGRKAKQMAREKDRERNRERNRERERVRRHIQEQEKAAYRLLPPHLACRKRTAAAAECFWWASAPTSRWAATGDTGPCSAREHRYHPVRALHCMPQQ